MKKVILLIVVFFTIIALYSQTETVKGISFKNLKHDYETVEQGGNGDC